MNSEKQTTQMMEEKLKLLPAWMFTFLIMDFVIVMIIIFAVSKNETPQETIQLVLIIGAFFTLLIVSMRLIHFKVKMEYRHFSVRLVPFSFKARIIEPEEIVSWKIRPFRAMREFSGFGKRTKGDVTGYAVDSKFAIEFVLKNGKKIVVSIGDQVAWQKTFEKSSAWAEKMEMK